MSLHDEEFSKRLAATLDKSVDTLDADTRARLAAMRRTALTRHHSRRVIGGLALAASLALLILVPWSLRHSGSEHNPIGGSAEDMAYLSVDPQMLEDMDMLQGLNELSDGDAKQLQGDS